MRLYLDRLVWNHLLREPCQPDHSRCPERARQCAACPHRGSSMSRWATTLSSLPRRLRALRRRLALLLDRPLILYFGLLFPSVFLGAALGWILASRLAR